MYIKALRSKFVNIAFIYGSILSLQYGADKFRFSDMKLEESKEICNEQTAKHPNIKFYEGESNQYNSFLNVIFLNSRGKDCAYIVGHEVAHQKGYYRYYNKVFLLGCTIINVTNPVLFWPTLLILPIWRYNIRYYEEARADRISLNNCSIQEIIEAIKIMRTWNAHPSIKEIILSRHISSLEKVEELAKLDVHPNPEHRIKTALKIYISRGGSKQMLIDQNVTNENGDINCYKFKE